MLSVVILSYNCAEYIAEAINGVLMQIVNFNYNLIIVDDCSTDGTEGIIEKAILTHPKGYLIDYYRHDENIGMQLNGIFALQKCKNKYIALCESDDFWTDPLKLQKQVDFLELNIGCSLVFHSVNIQSEIKDASYCYPIPPKDVLNFEDVIFKHYIPTCSVVFRKDLLPNPLPNWYKDLKMGDIAIELMLASKGYFKFINSIMAVYRIHSRGITQNSNQILQGRKAYSFLYWKLFTFLELKFSLLIGVKLIYNYVAYIKDWFKIHKVLLLLQGRW